MSRWMDLNADAGEGGPDDEALFEAGITSVNAACGGHAGDVWSLVATARRAARHGVAFGAHPGYVDREGFGRRARAIDAGQLGEEVAWQVAAAREAALVAGVGLAHVKPHGALYHRLTEDEAAAAIFVGKVCALAPGAKIFGWPQGALRGAAEAVGVEYVAEGFLDRAYRSDGSLVPRGEAGALLEDEVLVRKQGLRLALEGRVGTLCVHGDGAQASRWLRSVAEALRDEGFMLASPSLKARSRLS